MSAPPAPPRDAHRPLPMVIQGGMGVAVSPWQLARAVALCGELGVVSGTAIDIVVARRLQDGDRGGHVVRALEHFPVPEIARRVTKRYLRPAGRGGTAYTPVPRLRVTPRPADLELMVVAGFVEVWLAKEGHDGLVGVNLLEKVQMATAATVYGTMLAGVDYVLMGAGIPTELPVLLDRLAAHEVGQLDVDVHGGTRPHITTLDPVAITGGGLPPLRRPQFLAIVSADVLAGYLAREDRTRPDGYVIEGPTAGGHNAPPRGRLVLDDSGQPVYGPRDDANLAKIAKIGLPFWLAGSAGTPEQVRDALAQGAAGVQVGTLFALSAESGFDDALRADLLARLAAGTLDVRTDPLASPTGFPFKVASLPGTLSDPEVYAARPRLCDLGYLRIPYERAGGAVGYRCPAEPVDIYVRKGGDAADTVGRACLCNALTATVDLEQTRRDGYVEPAIVTLGTGLEGAARLLAEHPRGWTAAEAVAWLRAGVATATATATLP